MVAKDTEKILLASWLRGENTNHMEYFSTVDFPENPMVFAEIASGNRDPITIARKVSIDPQVLSDIIGCYSPYLYDSAMQELARHLAHRWIADNMDATPMEMSEALKRFNFASDDLPQATDSIDGFLQELEARADRPIVNTGLKDLDRLLCGIRKKELTSIGARPSVGKSAFVQQVALQVARQGHKVLFFPLEMSEQALLERMLMRYVEVPHYEVKTGFKPETWAREDLSEAFSKLDALMKSGKFLIYEGCTNLQTIKRLIDKHEPYLVVIDQLEQLSDGKQRWSDKRQRFSHMTHELQRIAMDKDVAVWLACQVNRSADDSEPTMANLKESGTIEEDSDNVILLHRVGDKTAMQDINLNLAKQRNGECGQVGMMFKANRYTFYGEEK